MSVDRDLAMRVCRLMNELTDLDRAAVAAMLSHRTPCNEALANHPTVQVASRNGGHDVGIMGVLNGLCGIHADGFGPIGAVYNQPTSEHRFEEFAGFGLTHDADCNLTRVHREHQTQGE